MLFRKRYVGPTLCRPSIRLFFLLVLIILTFASIGCNSVGSSAPQTAASSLTFQPQSLTFNASSGQSGGTSQSLTVTNIGSTSRTILSIICQPGKHF